MKPKKVNKKLALNKKTIAHLGDDVLNGARGGVSLGTICCPDVRPSMTCVTPNTDYYTCVAQTCDCTQWETCGCTWLPTCGIFC
jgi:hypothetical protein